MGEPGKEGGYLARQRQLLVRHRCAAQAHFAQEGLVHCHGVRLRDESNLARRNSAARGDDHRAAADAVAGPLRGGGREHADGVA